MAYYDTLVAAWNSTQLPSGVTGTALSAGLTTAQKLAAINAWTVAGAPADVSARDVRGTMYGLGKWAAVAAKANAARANVDTSAAALACQNLYDLANSGETIPMTIAPISGQINADLSAMVTAGVIDATTQTAVLALASTLQPWWQYAGYSSPISAADLQVAGGLS